MEVINALGRRKTSVARVILKSGKGDFIINDPNLNFTSSVEINFNQKVPAFNIVGLAVRLIIVDSTPTTDGPPSRTRSVSDK